MKKKILTLVGAMVLTVAMSLNLGAGSVTASSNNTTNSSTGSNITTSNNNTSTDTNTDSSTNTGSSSTASGTTSSSTTNESLATGTQQFTSATLAEFAETTTIKSGVAGATITVVSDETAAAAIAQAKSVVGNNAFVAAVFDLNASEAGTFTLTCPNVWAGQKVIILHQLSNGTWETITPSKVANNEVTFSMTSYSPVAIVIDTTAGKTADVAPAVAVMALICLAGAVVFGRKKSVN